MGNKQSSIYRRVQPALCYPYKYSRLSSSINQPLLVNNHDESVEQLQREVERNRMLNESLERRNANLENDMRELKAAINNITSQKEHPIYNDKKVAALEKQLLEFEASISKLQSASSQPGSSGCVPETTLLKNETKTSITAKKQDDPIGTQKCDEFDKLLIDLMPTLQTKTTDYAMNKDIATGVQKADELGKHQKKTTESEKQDTPNGEQKLDGIEPLLIDLTTPISQTKTTNDAKIQKTTTEVQKHDELDKQLKGGIIPIHQTKMESDCLVAPVEQEFGNLRCHDSINDLVGCLIVLIFLVGILIGINL